MNLDFILTEISSTQKDKYVLTNTNLSYMWKLKLKQPPQSQDNKKTPKLTATESRMGWGEVIGKMRRFFKGYLL